MATYTLSNSTWLPLGDPTSIPGPVTALEVNNGNEKSVFAAGRYVILHFISPYTEFTHPTPRTGLLMGPPPSSCSGMVQPGLRLVLLSNNRQMSRNLSWFLCRIPTMLTKSWKKIACYSSLGPYLIPRLGMLLPSCLMDKSSFRIYFRHLLPEPWARFHLSFTHWLSLVSLNDVSINFYFEFLHLR